MEKEAYVRDGERLDDLQIKDYFIIQHPDKFCFGMDAVLLSHFVMIPENGQALDLGTGTGILPILLTAKQKARHFDALEIQRESVDMAKRSVLLNGLADKIEITEGDIKSASSIFKKGSYDVVFSNPPYMNDKHGLKNPGLPKAIARHEILCTLEDVVREASLLLKPKKSFFMIHRPHRLVEIFEIFRSYHLEPKRMCMVHPYIHKEPNMVLLEGIKDGNPMLKTEPPIIVYQAPNVYTDQLLDIYRTDGFRK
ncbi:MAG: tRNA1(Val) (adenine(37)-N6)-methyltransferase [Lachnospiraceae bacterium]|nr:tRNA1(Val) (adenine(37)-N6)-methyltransferase [Lachnospiraceae bacterium]